MSWQEVPNGVRFLLQPSDGSDAKIDATFEASKSVDDPVRSRHFGDLSQAQAFLSELYVAFGGRWRDGQVEVVRIARTPWESQVIPDRGGLYRAMSQDSYSTRPMRRLIRSSLSEI
jgi:hypothetical protein